MLCVHRLRPQGGSNERDLLAGSSVLDGVGVRSEFDNGHFDASVLLWADTLARLTIVIHAGLTVFDRVDGVALAKLCGHTIINAKLDLTSERTH